MTFSEQVKQELVRLPLDKTCCMLSELSALTQTCGALILRGGGRYLVRYSVQSAALAKRIFMLLKTRLAMTPVVQYKTSPRFGGTRILTLTVQEQDARRLLLALHMLRPGETGDVFRGVPRGALQRRCCRQAFLRGAFLGGGSVSSPEKAYHLEFTVDHQERAQALLDILYKCGLVARQTKRRGATVVYVKAGDAVADILTLMGASNALMALENVRITNQSRGQANRALNCDAANVKKQLQAAENQAEQIKRYSLTTGLGTLPGPLQEVARLRLLNPDVSLEQLGQLMQPPLGKSGVNHRLRKLMEIIREKEEGE